MDTLAAASHALPPVSPALAPRSTGIAEASAVLDRVEALLAGASYHEALDALSGVHVPSVAAPRVALRALHCEGWARLYLGDLAAAEAVGERARALTESSAFDDADRAEALFRLGACRLKLGKVVNAVSLFTLALRLAADASPRAVGVRARVFEWRSRCYQLQRDWEAAQADAGAAIELAQSLGDGRLEALAAMQCSLVAERRGDPLLARYYAERGRVLAAETGDRQTEARLVNNLGGLAFLLGEPETAVSYLKEAFALSLEIGNQADAAQAVSSLAQVHLRCGAPLLAEEQARHALGILDGRDDYVDERGNIHLVLGRALLAQERVDDALAEFAAAEWLFERLGSRSHVAAAWLAEGDAYRFLGDLDASAELYRRAAAELQDFSF